MQGQEGDAHGHVPADRHTAVDALQRHGIARAVAAELWRAAIDLRRRTRRRGIEHAITLDADDGQLVGSMLTGTATSTDITPHLLAFRSGHEYALLHTHPLNTSFSPFDVLILTEQPSIRVMIAVGVDGAWYVVSRLPETSVTHPRSMFDDCINERRRLAQQHVTPSEIAHLAMESVASLHGLRYDRVVGVRDA